MEKTDYLILLVGKNPSPNFISALTYCTEETKLFLVYTKKTEKITSSLNVAWNLETSIKKFLKNISIEKIEVDKNNTEEINKVIEKEILPKIYKDKNIILDFTGSTKIISAIFNNKFSELNNKNIYFSYVSERTNEVMKFNYKNQQIEKIKTLDIANKYNISFEDLLSIHGESKDLSKDRGEFSIEDMESNEFILHINFKVKNPISTKKNLINVFFDINSLAEKLGGSNVTYTIEINKIKESKDSVDEIEEQFYDDIKNITNIQDIESKIKLKVLEG